MHTRLTGRHEESSLSGRDELADCTLGELLAWLAEVEDQGRVGKGDLDQRGETETVVPGIV